MKHVKAAPLVLDADAVAALLPSVDVLGAMRALFAELGHGKAVQPPQTLTLLPGDAGDFITYLGAIAGAGVFGTKLSPYLVQPGGPLITAWTVLMSMQTGQPLLLCNAGQLTVERTAATTALAVDCLMPQTVGVLAVVGGGRVALAHLCHTIALRNWRDVRVFAPRFADNHDLRREWQAVCPTIRFVENAEAAAQGADVTMLCTSSGQPVLDTTVVAPGALITSISTNVANAHEVPPAFLGQADVYCDYRATTPTSAGEMKLAVQHHGWTSAAIRGDLAELAIDGCNLPSGDRPVFFRSIGLGLEDVAMAHAIWQAARA